jgi:ABC-type branched-subunit amino acid transport system ATPase component
MPTSSAETRDASAHLRVVGVAAGYGPVPVIRDVSITVSPGEIAAVVGPNGAGKSTLLKAILGIARPSAGSISLAGARIDGLRTDQIARRGVGYVPQVKDVFEPLTVKENLEMGGYTLALRDVPKRVDEVMEIYPALARMRNRSAGYLSGGERKLLAVGRVLMRRPSLLVLDEPTAGLAPQLAHELLFEHVTRLAGTGIAILLVEQHTHDALAVAQWAYVMASGQVRLAGPAAGMAQRPDLGDIFLGRATNPAITSADGSALPVSLTGQGQSGLTGARPHPPGPTAGTSPALSGDCHGAGWRLPARVPLPAR